MCWINLVAKVAYAMGPELSRAPISLGLYFFVLKTFFSFLFFLLFFGLSIFFPQGRMQDLPNGGGGGGGAPLQALAPGRWRPSLRHWSLDLLLDYLGEMGNCFKFYSLWLGQIYRTTEAQPLVFVGKELGVNVSGYLVWIWKRLNLCTGDSMYKLHLCT